MTTYPHYVMRQTLTKMIILRDPVHQYIGEHGSTLNPAHALTFTDITAAKEAAEAPGFRPVLRIMADLAAPCPVCNGTRTVCETGLFWAERLPCLHCATFSPEPQP